MGVDFIFQHKERHTSAHCLQGKLALGVGGCVVGGCGGGGGGWVGGGGGFVGADFGHLMSVLWLCFHAL